MHKKFLQAICKSIFFSGLRLRWKEFLKCPLSLSPARVLNCSMSFALWMLPKHCSQAWRYLLLGMSSAKILVPQTGVEGGGAHSLSQCNTKNDVIIFLKLACLLRTTKYDITLYIYAYTRVYNL